jgi:hypothetical protein
MSGTEAKSSGCESGVIPGRVICHLDNYCNVGIMQSGLEPWWPIPHNRYQGPPMTIANMRENGVRIVRRQLQHAGPARGLHRRMPGLPPPRGGGASAELARGGPQRASNRAKHTKNHIVINDIKCLPGN